MLCPADGDVASPDVAWSYTGFGMFRHWLAQAEGFHLDEMWGFGGERPWSDVSTTLKPLLDHPDDDGPDLTSAQCAALLPRLREIIDQRGDSTDPLVQRRVDDTGRLVAVLHFCIEQGVDLMFC
ncbi:hypothetical protein [Streptomyces sp. YIM S03343]